MRPSRKLSEEKSVRAGGRRPWRPSVAAQQQHSCNSTAPPSHGRHARKAVSCQLDAERGAAAAALLLLLLPCTQAARQRVTSVAPFCYASEPFRRSLPRSAARSLPATCTRRLRGRQSFQRVGSVVHDLLFVAADGSTRAVTHAECRRLHSTASQLSPIAEFVATRCAAGLNR